MKKMTRKEIEAQFEEDREVLERWHYDTVLKEGNGGVFYLEDDGLRFITVAPEQTPPAKNELVWCLLNDWTLKPEISTGNFDKNGNLRTSDAINNYQCHICERWYCPRTGQHSPDFPMHVMEVLPK